MVFTPPQWVSQLPEIPDNVSLPEFMFNEVYGRHLLRDSRPPFVCGLSGKSYSASEFKQRVNALAKGLGKELGWAPGEGSEWDKVVAVFTANSIDTLAVASAAHRLDGIVTMVNAVYGVRELVYQLNSCNAKCIFTCGSLIPTAIQAAKQVGIPRNHIYTLTMSNETTPQTQGFETVDRLITLGNELPEIECAPWPKGRGARQCAFLCYSSGTSGLPKGVIISHMNVIANVLQIATFEKTYRDTLAANGRWTEVVLGLLPQSHIYGLVVISYTSLFRGDSVVVLPKYEMHSLFKAIQQFQINVLNVVPPIIIEIVKKRKLVDQWDLGSVYTVFTGAAPLGKELACELQRHHPSWKIRQAYGLTETCTVVCSTSAHDICLGSSGSFLPGYSARLVSPEGVEIEAYGQPGELLVRSPSVSLGYLNNIKANQDTFINDKDGNRWMRTGDEVVIQKAPSGNEHVYIVDRIKELIKVKGMQVAPAELEAHLLSHPAVSDVAVIPVQDDRAGELPRAIVVISEKFASEDKAVIAQKLQKYVEDHTARHKWLRGGVGFTNVIPKSPSGKILRRLLRDQEVKRKRVPHAKI